MQLQGGCGMGGAMGMGMGGMGTPMGGCGMGGCGMGGQMGGMDGTPLGAGGMGGGMMMGGGHGVPMQTFEEQIGELQVVAATIELTVAAAKDLPAMDANALTAIGAQKGSSDPYDRTSLLTSLGMPSPPHRPW